MINLVLELKHSTTPDSTTPAFSLSDGWLLLLIKATGAASVLVLAVIHEARQP